MDTRTLGGRQHWARSTRLLIAALLALALGIATPPVALANDLDESITSFETNVVVSKENVATITEKISYNFGSDPNHGFYRDIPIDYKDGKDKYYLSADFLSAKDADGKPVETKTETKKGNLRVRIGDPDVGNLTGVHKYVLRYKLYPLITRDSKGQPLLTIDAVGTGWPLSIDQANATVELEGGAQLSDMTCNTGKQGSTGVCLETSDSAFAAGLRPNEGLTITARVPEGYVTKYLEVNKKRPFDLGEFLSKVWWLFIAVPTLLALGVFGLIRRLRVRSRRKGQTVVAEFDPPEGFIPAEIGLLDEDQSGMKEVTATIVDLAVRGFIKIERIETGGLMKGHSYRLWGYNISAPKRDEESQLLQAIFAKGSPVNIDDLDKQLMSDAIDAFKAATKRQLSHQGFYFDSGKLIDRGSLTPEGAKAWAKVAGFKMYLDIAEKDRLNFTDAPEKTPERFNKLLPYAIALGVEEKWAKEFEGIDLAPTTSDWYYGGAGFTFSASSVSTDLSSSFGDAVQTNSTVSTSSSSGGGSFSGGGFGGGGGGSW